MLGLRVSRLMTATGGMGKSLAGSGSIKLITRLCFHGKLIAGKRAHIGDVFKSRSFRVTACHDFRNLRTCFEAGRLRP